MELTTTCPSCGTTADRGWPALVAPFIAEYVLRTPVMHCRLLECEGCSHRFYNQLFTDSEIERLYADYRGAIYFTTRNRHEPWYTQTYNCNVGHEPGRVESRKASLGAFLGSGGLLPPLESVLDFGGDSGQLIPFEWARERFVYDLSGVSSVEGVHKIDKDCDLDGKTFDLVILTHVLEHASSPLGLMTRIRRLLTPAAGHVYVEVPLERPWTGFLGRGQAMECYLDLLRAWPGLLRMVDLYSSAFRVKAGFFPPLGFPKLHEHIHFFSEESIRQLLGRAGYEITFLRQVASSGRGKPDSLGCLARPKTSP